MREFILAFAGSFCAGILFNIRGRNLIWAGLSGVAGWMVYTGVNDSAGSMILSIFSGAIAVAFYSELAARLLKSPATVFSIPGIFPLVPGIAAYETIQYLVENKLPQAASKAVETLAGAGAIAFGILLATAFFRFMKRKKNIA